MALTSDEIRRCFTVSDREYKALMRAVYLETKPDIRPLVKFIFDKVSDVMGMNNEDLELDIKEALSDNK